MLNFSPLPLYNINPLLKPVPNDLKWYCHDENCNNDNRIITLLCIHHAGDDEEDIWRFLKVTGREGIRFRKIPSLLPTNSSLIQAKYPGNNNRRIKFRSNFKKNRANWKILLETVASLSKHRCIQRRVTVSTLSLSW